MEQIMTWDSSKVRVLCQLLFCCCCLGVGWGWWWWWWWDRHLYVRILIDCTSLQVYFHLDTWTSFLSVWWLLVVVNCFILHPALFLEGEVNKGKIVGYTIHSWGCGVICSHTHACTCMQSHACTHSHTHTHTLTHRHTHMHAHTHTNQPWIKFD